MDASQSDIVIVGVGAAGLMASISAGRAARDIAPRPRILALDGARSLGAKILVAGGGRCNVTHHHVDETAYAGSSRHAIKKVLRSFDVPRTTAFFEELGVHLKQEETGKLFPVTDSARTVLNALLDAARDASVDIMHPWRVHAITRTPDGFVIDEAPGPGPAPPRRIACRRVILATGGMSLPKSGSDGHGYALARALGHTITPRVFPALVPLVLDATCVLRELSGITLPATLEVRAASGKRLESFTNSTLLTHFGLSGPSVLDISRYFLDARADDRGATLHMNFLPGVTPRELDERLQNLGRRGPRALLRESLPERLADALCAEAGLAPDVTGATLTKDARRALVTLVTEFPLPVSGDRGYTYAEVTAGGVPLSEIRLDTMESRACPGLHLCGEICDVDGRIGGFNFQWAWASGHVAGVAAARALVEGEG